MAQRGEGAGRFFLAPRRSRRVHLDALTTGLLRRLADTHYLDVYDHDFRWRDDLWISHDAEEAFWCGDIIALPSNHWVEIKGRQHSYFARPTEEPVLEDVFLYAVFRERERRLQALRQSYKLGESSKQGTAANALLCAKGIRCAMPIGSGLPASSWEPRIKALEDLGACHETSFDSIVEGSPVANPRDRRSLKQRQRRHSPISSKSIWTRQAERASGR